MLLGILIIIAIWDVSKSAVRNARSTAPSAPRGPAQAPQGRTGSSAPRGVRQRQAGYWLREGLGGFPAARTGWHAGWLAHRAALAQQRNIREAARTNHLETERDTAASIREHRRRQSEALREIEDELAAQQAKGSPATGRKAVQRAADEVGRRRQQREQANGPRCPGCGAPDGYDHLEGCDPSVPPLPASNVRTAADYPRSAMFPGMRPWTAASPEVTSQRQSVDYWADVEGNGRRTPINWQTDGDGTVSAEIPPGVGWPSIQETARQQGAILDRATGRLVRTPEPEVIDTPVRVHNAEDSSWLKPGEPRCEGCGGTGRNDAGNDACPVCRGWGGAAVGPEFMPAAPAGTVCNACGRKGTPEDPVLIAPGGTTTHRSHAAAQHETYKDALKRLYPDDGEIDDAVIGADHGFEGEYDTHPSPTTTGGAPVTADTSYKSALANAKDFAAECDQAATEAKARRTRAEQDVEGMQALDVDGATTSSAMDMLEELQAAEKATESASDHAAAYADGLQKRHGGIDAAVDDAPIPQAAHRDFYGQG